MKVFICSDTHGGLCNGFSKLNSKSFSEGQYLTSNDIVIICGDFGLTWPNYKERLKQQNYWKNWLYNKPWTTVFICGNHEDHTYLQALDTAEMFGGKVGVINDKLLYLRRGEIFDIADHSFFCMGGAMTTDLIGRIEGIHWFREEIPSSKEMYYAIDNLESHNNTVDYIIAHTLPKNLVKCLLNKYDISLDEDVTRLDEVAKQMQMRYADPTTSFLQEVCNRIKFKHYYCGHFHEDCTIGDRFTILYDKVIELI